METSSFTIEAGASSPSATWTLQYNYFDRLAYIKDGTVPAWAPVGWNPPTLPVAYQILKANYWDATDERDEAAYNWDNWSWLRVDTSGPEDATVIIEILVNKVTITDTHVADISRNQDFDYSTDAAIWTYSVTVPGVTYIDLRLPNEYSQSSDEVQPDLRFVSSVTLRFDESEDPQVYEVGIELTGKGTNVDLYSGNIPALGMGSGGGNLVTFGLGKIDNSPPPNDLYHFSIPEEGDDTAQLWSAAVVDGKPCARIPDDFTKRVQQGLPYYDAYINASDGSDIGVAYTLTGAAVLLWNMQEGFEASVANSVLNAMEYEDGDTNKARLYTACAYDVQEQRFLSPSAGGIPVAMRCKAWVPATIVQQSPYCEKHIHGGAWGWVKSGDVIDTSSELFSYHAPIGSLAWEYEGSGTADSTGLITPLMVPGSLKTGIAETLGGTVYNLDVIPPREFALFQIEVEVEGVGRFTLQIIQGTARILHFYGTSTGIEHIYSNPETAYFEDPDSVSAGYDNPHDDTESENDVYPSAIYTERGRVYLFWLNDANVYYQYSDDMGGTWSASAMALIGYERGFFWYDWGQSVINFAGVMSDGTVKYVYSPDKLVTLSTAVEVTTGADVEQPSAFSTERGRMCIIYSKSDTETMSYSDDGGKTWTEA